MGEPGEYRFNRVIREIIKKSLFTERQIRIILNYRDRAKPGFGISRGAYYRQAGQSRDKLARFCYTAALLRALGILPDDAGVISRLAEQISVIKDSDVFPEREDEVLEVMDAVVRQACRL